MGTSFQLFNLETMSGVFPGTRTMVFQRVRVRPLPAAEDGTVPAAHSVRLLWYEEPPACVVELGAALLRLPEPLTGDFAARLQAALGANGAQLLACGSCRWWQPLAIRTADGLPTGLCAWQHSGRAGVPQTGGQEPADTMAGAAGAPHMLLAQSALALDCRHWQAAAILNPAVGPGVGPHSSANAGASADDASPAAAAAPPQAHPDSAPHTFAPIAKRSERESDERWTWYGRLRRWLGTKRGAQDGAAQAAVRSGGTGQAGAAEGSWAARIVERSGVGAGTEPCFACQGRIANLGALAVASPEGDKQTFSVWRCRQCFTYYLNDWIDRWERTDSLETEETYYRLAPQEALEALRVIDGVVDAEHPARRHERDAQRAWMVEFIGARAPLSHQIKQGR
jgi:hypothetical protein